jgi:hypothetical protein
MRHPCNVGVKPEAGDPSLNRPELSRLMSNQPIGRSMRSLSLTLAFLLVASGITMTVEVAVRGHGATVITLGLVFGIIVALGAIPFARAARRMSARPSEPVPASRSLRHQTRLVAAGLLLYSATIALLLSLPFPTGVRIVGFIILFLGIPFALVAQADAASARAHEAVSANKPPTPRSDT